MTEVARAVGRFEIVREIGRGGMARVYLARQSDLDRLVALKELSAFHASDPQFAQRFLRESRLAGSLSHPNIVTVHEYFEHEGTPYIAMEYVPRGSLRPYVGRLSLAQVVGVIEGMLAGLTHAESKGIVHRDLKPENVMVTDEGRIKIADFGIAKAGSGVSTGGFLTATGTTVGTPAYMAPEQAMARDIGPWTDLYSLGIMAYEMLVGRLPFPENEAPMVLLMRQVNEPVPPPRSVNADLDEDLSAWIERLLAKDPRERIRSATDAWDELEETVIRIFGARWRREARLPAPAAAVDELRPLTPAPFTGAQPPAEESDEFQSFAWGNPLPPTPGAEVSPTPEPEPEVAPGPPPEPAEAPDPAEPLEPPPPEGEPATPLDPLPEAIAEPDFKTFGARRPRPAPVVEPVAVPEPEPVAEPEEEWGATVPPSRLPTPPPPAEPAAQRVAAGEQEVGRADPVRPRGPVIAVLAGAVVLALVAGFLIAPSKNKAGRAAGLSNSASSGVVELAFPGNWRRAAASPDIPGLALTDPVTLTGPTVGMTVEAGRTDGTAPTLLPPAFLRRLPGGPPNPEAVRLGSVAAYRYTALNAASPAQRLTVYAVPTEAGVVTVACVGAGAVASPDCEAIASSLRLRGAKAFPLGPDAGYAQALGGALDKLNRDAAGQAQKLGSARSRAGQASAAQALARTYTGASTTIAGLPVRPAEKPANAAIAGALKALGRDYQALGAAAGGGDRTRYTRVSAAVAADEANLTKALAGLHGLGYAPS